MKPFLKWIYILFPLSFLILLSACLPNKKITVAATATLLEEVARSSSKQSDLKMLREGMPAYLMLMDGMIEAWPDNDRLLIAAAQGYSSFASTFADDEDKEYADRVLGKGRQYALRALELRGFKDPQGRPLDNFKEGLKALRKKDVPYIFWAANCWASWINFNLDSMEALAELPRVEWMMKRVLELDEGFYYGGAHLFMGIWLASRPKTYGGDLKKSQEHFLRAIELGEGKLLMAYVYYANHYARQAQDKTLFVSALQKVLETPANILPDLTLLNTVAQEKAKELLSREEEYFE